MPGHDHDVNDAASDTPRRRDFLRYSGGAAAAGGIAGAIAGTVISAPEGANAATVPMPMPSGTPSPGQVPVATDALGDSAWTWLVLEPSGQSSGVPDTANLNALMTATPNPSLIQLAPGTFWVNNLALTNGTYIRGSGQGSTILKLPAGANGCVLTNSGGTEHATPTPYTTATVTGITGNQNIGLEDLTVDGNKASAGKTAVDAVNFTGCGYVTIKNVELRNATRHGLYLGGNQLATSRYSTTDNVTAHDCGSHGIWISNGQRVVSSKNITAYSNGLNGLFLDASECQVDGAYAFQNGSAGSTGVGIKINNVFDCIYMNMKANRNDNHGIYVTCWADGSGSGWQAFENGASGTSGWADIYFDDGIAVYGSTTGVVIDGIRCGRMYNPAHRWVPSATSPVYTPDYGLYCADGLGTGGGNGLGNVYMKNVLIGAAGVQSLRAPQRAILTLGSNLWVEEAGQSGSPSFIQQLGSNYIGTAGTTSVPITVGFTEAGSDTADATTKGNTVMVAVHAGGGTAGAGCTDTKLNTYVLDAGNVASSAVMVWRARITTPLENGDTITVTFRTNSATGCAAVAWEERKIGPTPVDGAASVVSGSAVGALATGTVTTTHPYSSLLTVLSLPATVTVTPPANFTTRINYQASGAQLVVAERIPYTSSQGATPGPFSGTWKISPAQNCSSAFVAYQP